MYSTDVNLRNIMEIKEAVRTNNDNMIVMAV